MIKIVISHVFVLIDWWCIRKKKTQIKQQQQQTNKQKAKQNKTN